MSRWRVLEVHNFGGFFGGDTVTLTAARCEDGVEETLTIDEKSLANLQDRFAVAPEMVFDFLMAGERVDRAALLGAAEWSLLAPVVGKDDAASEPLAALRIRAYWCEHCQLWIIGEPIYESHGPCCTLCGYVLGER